METKFLKDLKVGEWFVIKPIENPKDSQVYIRGKYDRCEKLYECGRCDDFSFTRYFSGNRLVYVGFTY